MPEPQKLLNFFQSFRLKIASNTKYFGKFAEKTMEKCKIIPYLSNRWYLSLKSCLIFSASEHNLVAYIKKVYVVSHTYSPMSSIPTLVSQVYARLSQSFYVHCTEGNSLDQMTLKHRKEVNKTAKTYFAPYRLVTGRCGLLSGKHQETMFWSSDFCLESFKK